MSGWSRAGRGLLTALLLGAGSLGAQHPLTIVQFSLDRANLMLVADTVAGLTLILQPAIGTKEAKSPGSLIWLRFHPDSALEWINSAAYALAAPVAPEAPDGVQWSRLLKSLNAGGAVTIGRERKRGKLQKGHWLAVTDSVTGLRLEMTQRQADSMLRLVLQVGSLSRIDTIAATALEADRVDTPVKVVRQPGPPFRHEFARVLVQYIVDTDGRADPGSLFAFPLSDSTLIADALQVIRGSRFEPARRAGHPVRQLVRQVVTWGAERR